MSCVAWWTCALLAVAAARVYERCELARDLRRLGVRSDHISTWVCIAFHESRFDTAARNPSSGDHGLLQISELFWCGPGKVCGVPCSAFRDEDIADDVACAQLIHEEHTRLQGDGFLAWVVYPQHCKHNTKKYLADCDSLAKNTTVESADKQRALNNVNSTYAYSNIDELQPPYLAINSLLRGGYRNDFEPSYQRNWLDFKVDNIDELTLPVFGKKYTSGKQFAITTPVPTRISTATTRATQVPRSRFTTTQKPVRRISFTTTAVTPLVTHGDKQRTAEKKHYHFSISSKPAGTATPKKYYETTPYITTKIKAPSTLAHNIRTFSNIFTTRPTTTLRPYNSYPFTRQFTTARPTYTYPTTTKKPPTTTAKRYHFSFTRLNATTTNDQKFSEKQFNNNNIQFSTLRPFTARQFSTSRSFFSRYPSKTAKLNSIFQSSTPKPFTSTTVSPTRSIQQKFSTKATQSIFDLYLKPTERPKLQPFSFSSIDSPYRLKIFADGTTPSPQCRNGCKKPYS